MRITQVSCSNCSGGRLKHIEGNRYECEYCGTMFFVEDANGSGELGNATVSGVGQDGLVFAVHGKLTVSGVGNDIKIIQSSAQARHVDHLVVSGVGNDLKVVLLDGAYYDISGVGNDIKQS